jgi:hypothetical protein
MKRKYHHSHPNIIKTMVTIQVNLTGGRGGNIKNQNGKMQILSNVLLVPKSAGGKLINVPLNATKQPPHTLQTASTNT